MKAAPEPKKAEPIESTLVDEVARQVSSRISDHLVDLEKTVREQMNNMLPAIVQCGLGVKLPSKQPFRRFEFMVTNNFSGLIEGIIKSAADVHAAENAEGALEAAISSLRDSDGIWHKEFVAIVESRYDHGYRARVRNTLTSQFDTDSTKVNNDLNSATQRVANAVSHAIGDLRMVHENRLRVLRDELAKSLADKRDR